jgi:[ribosomal protein S18]-alanine N-acetyltransferase
VLSAPLAAAGFGYFLRFRAEVLLMPATLREYDPADFDAMYALDRACYPPGISYSRRTLKWFLALPGADCLVAESGEKHREIVGFIIAEGLDMDGQGILAGRIGERTIGGRGAGQQEIVGHIITIDIAESSRRSGVGSALLRAVEQRLAARGVSRVTLETATSNEAAVAFWQRHGYRTHGVLPRYYLGRLDAYSMSKKLGPPGGPATT